MDLVQQLGAALGLGLLSGVRLYLTVLVLGAAIHFKWLQVQDTFAGLAVLADWRVMAFAATGCLIEFVADKIPWVDSTWDTIHTFIRPLGAIVLGANAFSTADPALRTMLILLCGGVALTGHSAKTATRLAVNHSPEPFSNIALSLAGDLAVPFVAWFTFKFPLVTLGAVSVFVIAVWWFAPKIYRAMRVEFACVAAALRRWIGGSVPDSAAATETANTLADAPSQFAAHLQALPDSVARALAKRQFQHAGVGIRCAAGKSIPGMRSSIGYLVPAADGSKLVFVTRRWMRDRYFEAARKDVSAIRWRERWIADSFQFSFDNRLREFEVFRVPAPAASPVSAASSAA